MSEISVPPDDFRSGFVTLVGRPNAGKSTLLNKILGQKVSIVSDKPQTTRTQVRGVLTRATRIRSSSSIRPASTSAQRARYESQCDRRRCAERCRHRVLRCRCHGAVRAR